jgi:hypothetical protein
VEVRERRGQREVRITGSGYAGWALRGGRAADAYTALWGGVFDWLAEARNDARAAVPARAAYRTGEPVRWRRGGGDSLVTVRLVRTPETGTPPDARDSVTVPLAFPGGGREVDAPSLAPGLWRGALAGGAVLLAVNPAREWVPRPPGAPSSPAVQVLRPTAPRRLVEASWPFLVVLLLVSAEWIGRRFAGYR